MDVDASERRPDGRRRRSDALQRRRPKRAGPAATGRSPVMENDTRLYMIQEPEAPGESNVFQLNAIRSYFHGLATPHPVGPPWPHFNWQEQLRRIAARPVASGPESSPATPGVSPRI